MPSLFRNMSARKFWTILPFIALARIAGRNLLSSIIQRITTVMTMNGVIILSSIMTILPIGMKLWTLLAKGLLVRCCIAGIIVRENQWRSRSSGTKSAFIIRPWLKLKSLTICVNGYVFPCFLLFGWLKFRRMRMRNTILSR